MATPPDTVAVVVPWSGPAPLLSCRRHHRGVVARLDVAVLVDFLDHRLRGERLAGRGRRRGLRLDHQLAGRRRGHGDGVRGRAINTVAGDNERIAGGGRGERQAGEGGHAARCGDGKRAAQRRSAGVARQRHRHRAVEGGDQVARAVLGLDGQAEGAAGGDDWSAAAGSPPSAAALVRVATPIELVAVVGEPEVAVGARRDSRGSGRSA